MDNIDNWLHELLDEFTTPGKGERYLKNLEVSLTLSKIKEIEVEAKVNVLEQLTEGAGVSDKCCSVHLQAIELLAALKAQDTKGGEDAR